MNLFTYIKNLIKRNEPDVLNKDIFEFDSESNEFIDLNTKVNAYLEWYKKYLALNTENVEIETQSMINFIEKIAVWYELAYPDEDVLKIITNMYQDSDFKEKSLISKDDFIARLNPDEEYLLRRYIYPEHVFINVKKYYTHFHLSPDGYITEVDDIADLDKSSAVIPTAGSFMNKHLSEVIPFFRNNDLLIENNELENAIEDYKLETIRLEGLLNSAMYRIIERGGNRVGPYRAFLFALEFNRNIEIPIQYGYDTSDPHLREFVNEYFKAGGRKNITCYTNYFNKEDFEEYEEENLEDMFPNLTLNCVEKYTQEEKNLQERLVNIIHTEQVKKLKLQKK